ncbi:MAG: hypothetical protein HXO16_01885 [Prevotella salivae]|nr:hypothetical protein [Segatella salivae]
MKIELQNGDRITIPEGCKAQINGNEVVVEKEKKEEAKTQEFKDGDVLTSLFNNKVVFIFKEDELKQKDNRNGYYVCHTADYVIDVPTKDSLFFCGHKKDVRLATEEEKQLFFDKMKEQGLRWNAEEKRVEKIRWRAKKGEAYCRMGLGGGVFYEIDRRTDADNVFYDTLNYFHTEEQTKEAARRVKEVLRKFHEEIGE